MELWVAMHKIVESSPQIVHWTLHCADPPFLIGFKHILRVTLNGNRGVLVTPMATLLLAGETVYNNSGENLYEVYKDLWKTNSKQQDMMSGLRT